MSTRSQLTKDLNESLKSILGRRTKILVKYMVKLETKSDKTENRVLIFTPVRIYILIAKVPTKIDCHFHYLDIQSIESKTTNQFSIITVDRTYTFSTTGDAGNFSSNADVILTDLVSAIKQIFPTVPLKYIIRKIDIQPNERETIFSDELRPSDPKNIGPCGGYSTQYACMCDFHGVPYREEVAWDIDTIYLSHDTRILNLRDFDHLDSKDLMAIVSALEYNTFFRGLKASHVRLSHETLERILHVLRRSMWLEELHLEALGLKADFLHKLAISVITNNNPALRTIDLSHNLIEDKGAIHLAGPIAKVSKGLCKLCLSHCGLTSKGVNQMAHSLTLNQSISSSLTHLDLSGNNFKDDINNLYNFLAQPNVLEHLNLSTTDTFLENLFGALLRGCSTHLTYLNVSHNSFSTKKGKEIPPSFKQFFTSSLSLKHLNIACCKLPLEALKNLLLGLACNESTTGLYLDLSGNALGVQGAHVLESCIHGVRVLQSLDISDNHLDIELSSVLNAIGKNPSIRTLHMTRIFTGMKLKHIVQVMDSLVNLIQKDDFPLTELVLSENKLKNDIHDFINALGSNQSLKVLDISGNLMGDVGARLLGKALQINNKLRTIIMDRNNITLQGYSDIVYALENNSSMKNIPFPIFDIAPSLKNHPERTDQIMRKMQEYLQRNSMGLKRPNAQGFRLQHGFLLSSTHQLIDKLISETEETISICRSSSDSGVQRLIDDAENSKQLLPKLQEAIRSEPHPIENKLGRIAIDLKQTVHCYLEEIVETMIRTGIEHCPKTLGNQIVINDLRKTCLEKINISDEFYQNCMLNNAGSEIMNKISEVEQLLTGIISDRGTDEVIDALTRYRRGLGISDSPSMHFQHDDTKSLDVDRRSNQSNQDSNDSTIAIRNFDFVSSIGLESPTKLEYLNLATPQLQTKRRSFAHKIRPQSVVENLSLGHIPDFLESQSSRTSFKGSSSHAAMMMMMKNDENCDSITELPSASFQLQHLVKGRPKRTKTRAPTRPLVTNEASSHPIGEGLEAFFRPGSVTPTTFTTPLVSPTSEECSSLSFADSPTMSRDDNGKNYFTSEESTPILEERKPLKFDRTSPALLKGIAVAQSASSAQWASTARSRSSDNLEKYSPLIGDRKSPLVNRSGGPQSIPIAACTSLPPSHQPPPLPPTSSSSSSSKSDESTLQLHHQHHHHHHQQQQHHQHHMQSSMTIVEDKSLHLQITQTNNYDKRRSPSNESIKGGTTVNSNYDTSITTQTTSTNTKLPTTPTPIKPRPHSITGNDGKSNDNHTMNDMINSTDAIDTGDVELIEGQPGGSIVGITPGAALGGGGSIVGISPGAAIERKSVRDMAAGLNRLGVDIIKVKQPQPLPRRTNTNNNSNGSISHITSPNKPLPPLPQSPTSPIILPSSLFPSSSKLTSSTTSTSSSSSSSSSTSTSSSTTITSNIVKTSSVTSPETRQIAGKKITTLFEETLFEGLQRSSFRQSVLREGQYNKDDAVDV